MRTADDLFAKCERDGEEVVRKRMAEKVYCTHDETSIVQEWLRRKDEERIASALSKRDEREEKTLSIARRANIIAIIAMILSATMTLITIIIQFCTKK
jgi:hypothetical protein